MIKNKSTSYDGFKLKHFIIRPKETAKSNAEKSDG
jgi:prolyl oligopeptidase PreP (S9A serine peptidase family)